MKLIQVDKNYIKQTSKFAKEVFIDYYTDLIGVKQSEYMVDLFLSEKAINKLIEEGAIFKLLLLDNEIIGFIEYQKQESKVFLSKLYIHKNYRNKGYGKILFNDCVQYTKSINLNKIYLTVNKYNTPSYNTYIHLGFKVIDSVINDIGNGYVMDDYIMEYII